MADTILERALAYLEEQLKASELSGLKGVTVFWGPPTGDDQPEKLVSVGFGQDGESGDSSREYKLVGNEEIDEEFRLDIACQAITNNPGRDLKVPYTASYAIAKAVETVIREDIHFGALNLIQPAVIRDWRGRWVRFDKSRGHRVFLTVTGAARI